MSMTKTGMEMDALWERKRKQIEQTKGTNVYRGTETFKDIRGLKNIINYLSRLMKTKNRYRGIVFLDEIEKMFAGSSSDSSGVTQEMLGTLLKFMEDKKAKGLLFIGQPGAAKSTVAKACGNEMEIPTIIFDVTAMKGSLVGESGSAMRDGLKMVEAVTQGRALFIATCNAIDNLPTALRRRFKRGTFFFDLPSEEERESILQFYMKRHGIKVQTVPDMTDWTGAEIEQCCEIADELALSLVDAAKYVVPIAKSAQEQVASLRRESHGRYISASYEGFYQNPTEQTTIPAPAKRRSIEAR
jgi:SpoVK/Ycf46/Vps4 family AAA+-type ATPase